MEAEQIAKLVPNLQGPPSEELETFLKNLGVETEEDLKLVTESDIENVVTKIQARKLIKAWNKTDSDHIMDNISEGSTVAVCDVSTLSSSSDSSNWIHDFKIPWERFPKALITDCEDNKRPKPTHRAEMVRVIVHEIFKFTVKPGSRNLEKVAYMIVSRFPSSFKNEIDGIPVGVGHQSLTQQLIYRVSNSTRSAKKFLVHTAESNHNKRRNTENYGCIDCSPQIDNEEDATASKTLLCNEYQKHDPDFEKVKVHMAKTYAFQRKAINRKPTMKELQTDWPFLFQEQFMLNHFTSLTNKRCLANMEIEEKARKVWKALKTKRKTKRVATAIKQEAMVADNQKCKLLRCFELVSAYMNEHISLLYQVFNDTSVEDLLTIEKVPVTPFIIILGDGISTSNEFYVVVERMVLARFNDFLLAFQYHFCLYYVFNMEYAVDASLTLEFFQRYFLLINEAGSRAKRRKGKESRVFNLIQKIEESAACCSGVASSENI